MSTSRSLKFASAAAAAPGRLPSDCPDELRRESDRSSFDGTPGGIVDAAVGVVATLDADDNEWSPWLSWSSHSLAWSPQRSP